MSGKHSKKTRPTSSNFPNEKSNYNKPINDYRGNPELAIIPGKSPLVISLIDQYLSSTARINYGATSISHRNNLFGTENERKLKITPKLLSAVAYGMESRMVNVDPKPTDLFARDLLIKSPEFLLERGNITDWSGRTFLNITAFEYALWAKDFKMLEMMLSCIPKTSDGDEIRAALLEQYNKVKAPIKAEGGLTYTLTYERANPVDGYGIPIRDAAGNWQTTSVTEIHTENHFDMTPLITAYIDYRNVPTWPQRDAYWIKEIGTLQRLLPIHLLQRYCEPGITFYPVPDISVYPVPNFTGAFKRTTQFYSFFNDEVGVRSLLSSSLSTNFALQRGGSWTATGYGRSPSQEPVDLAPICQLDEVSTNQIETKIKRQLMPPTVGQTYFRPS
jgi:hypothetical protein